MATRSTSHRPVPLAMLAALLCLSGCAPPGPAIEVEVAWARPTTAGGEVESPPAAPGVVYLTLRNDGGASDRLIGVRSAACESAELHVTRAAGGRVTMDDVDGIDVPPHGRVAMEPGATHIMLFGLRRHLRPGDTIEIALDFETAGEISTTVEVREP